MPDPFPTVLHVIRSQAWGGLEIYVDTLIKKMHQAGVPLAVYCIRDSIIDKSLREAGIKMYYASGSTKWSLRDIFALRKIARKEDIDIMHSHTNMDVWICALALIADKHRKHIFSLYMGVIAKKDFIHKYIYSKIDMLLSTSERINEDVRTLYAIDPAKVKLMRYGRDVEMYDPQHNERELIRNTRGTDNNKLIIGTMCRIDPSKGVKEFAASFLLLPEGIKQSTEYWIVGERTIDHLDPNGNHVYEYESDALYQWLHEFIASNGLENQIKLIPFQKNLQGYLAAMDIFVLASYNEMYALAVLDAMLMQLPVIGTNKGGTPEQLENNRGIIVESKSSGALAEAICKLHAHPEERKKMGASARQWALEQHDWKKVLPRYLNVYNWLKTDNPSSDESERL